MKPHFFEPNPTVNQTREIVLFPSAWRQGRGLVT